MGKIIKKNKERYFLMIRAKLYQDDKNHIPNFMATKYLKQ